MSSSINSYFAIPVLKDGFSLETVNSIKDRGNENFNKSQFTKAIKDYSDGIECFKTHDETANVDKSLCSLLAYLYSNRSACYAMVSTKGNLTDGIRDANMCIQLKPDWLKGYLRRADCLFRMGEYRLAALDYQTTWDLDNNKTYSILCKLKYSQAKSKEVDLKVLVHQIMPGKDICKKGVFPIQNLIFHYAQQMQNYIYIIGDRVSRECIVIDCCWDASGVIRYAKLNDLKIVGAAVTHCHFDHGGIPPPPFDSLRIKVEGLSTVLKAFPGIKAYAHPLDIEEIMRMNPAMIYEDFVPTQDNYLLRLPILGENSIQSTEIRFIHTPGHTAGSQCILINDVSLFSGDTLFIGSCGRIDLPGADINKMWDSLKRLQQMPESTLVYPGHSYNGTMTLIEFEKQQGVLKFPDKRTFLRYFTA